MMDEHYKMRACVKSELAPPIFLHNYLGKAIARGYLDVVKLIREHPNALEETRILADEVLAKKGA